MDEADERLGRFATRRTKQEGYRIIVSISDPTRNQNKRAFQSKLCTYIYINPYPKCPMLRLPGCLIIVVCMHDDDIA